MLFCVTFLENANFQNPTISDDQFDDLWDRHLNVALQCFFAEIFGLNPSTHPVEALCPLFLDPKTYLPTLLSEAKISTHWQQFFSKHLVKVSQLENEASYLAELLEYLSVGRRAEYRVRAPRGLSLTKKPEDPLTKWNILSTLQTDSVVTIKSEMPLEIVPVQGLFHLRGAVTVGESGFGYVTFFVLTNVLLNGQTFFELTGPPELVLLNTPPAPAPSKIVLRGSSPETGLCRGFIKMGWCKRGDNCQYVHVVPEKKHRKVEPGSSPTGPVVVQPHTCIVKVLDFPWLGTLLPAGPRLSRSDGEAVGDDCVVVHRGEGELEVIGMSHVSMSSGLRFDVLVVSGTVEVGWGLPDGSVVTVGGSSRAGDVLSVLCTSEGLAFLAVNGLVQQSELPVPSDRVKPYLRGIGPYKVTVVLEQ